MAGQNEDKPRYPRLLLCEGPKDVLFFDRFIEARNLQRFHIKHSGLNSSRGGKSKFGTAMKGFNLGWPKTFRSLSDILIVADNDDTPDQNFASICAQLESVFGAGTAPDAPLVKTNTTPRVTVLMLPWAGESGHLEQLCIPSARSGDQTIASHIDHFMALLNADGWTSESRRGKAWLRTSLAVRCASDPFVPLGLVFKEAPNRCLIPLEHASFQRIADVIAGI